MTGGLLEVSKSIYAPLGAKLRETDMQWTFPSGATVSFRHCQHPKDVYALQGAQITLIILDESVHFEESMAWYIFSRNRSTCGVKPYIRMTCNPDSDSWLRKFIDWWIGPDGIPIEERSGIVRWFVRIDGEAIWADSKEELIEKYPSLMPKSFTYIPAKLTDNKILMEKDPGYLSTLQALHPVERQRLLLGDWDSAYSQGKVFNRAWVKLVDKLPEFNRCRQIISVRFYDLAATAKEVSKDTSYYTAGVRMRLIMQYNTDYFEYWIDDFIAEQLGPVQGDDLIVQTAKLDGYGVAVRNELEGGSAGPRQVEYLRSRLSGYDYDGVRPQGDKLKRFIPFAEAAANGRVHVLNADWTPQYLSWLHSFDGTPEPGIADSADATSGAFNYLSQFDNTGLSWLSAI